MKNNRILSDFTTPKVMGILNLTLDSFYEMSRLATDKQLLEVAEQMLVDGASILDLGAQSTRPGSKLLSEKEEVLKIRHAVKLISKNLPEALISIDTFRSSVAKAGIDSGAKMINDISGFSFDPDLLTTISRNSIYYVLMHLKGNFKSMHNPYEYTNVIEEVKEYFEKKIELLNEIPKHQVILDPGFGFSKSVEQSHEILYNLEQLQSLEHPVLVGISRKSMIYKKLGIKVEESLNGTIALNAIALSKGAKILRVHDVKEAVELVKLVIKKVSSQ